jgi:hypothetical protein
MVSIVENNNKENYVPRTAAKVMVKIPHPVQVKAEKRNKDILLVKTAVALKTKPKRLNGNNIQMSDLPEFAKEKW